MNKTIILIIACLMAWVNSISAEDKIYVTDFSITAEETKDVSVLMDNDIPYVAFQFDLYLPEGITLAGYEVSGSRVPESTEISMAKMDDGSYRFIAAAMSMEEITGSSGGIVTLKLKASSEITTGIKTGYLKRVKLSKADATGFTTAESPFAIKVLAPITVTAKSYTRKYGEANPAFEYDVTGDMEGTPIVSCEATATSPVGTYPIVVAKGSVTNYNGSYVNGTLTIEKAPLTVTAKSYTIKQGEALPTFEVEYDGFKNDESVDVLAKKATVTCSATSASAPNTYDIVVSGAEAGNYEISCVKGTLTIVEADPVTVTAKSYTRKYGEANPEFEYTAVGVDLEGTPEITCEATETSSVGTYSIVVSKGSVANYNDTYINGTLTITKAPLSITAQSYVIKQGDTMPAFGVSIDGFKNKDTKDVFKKQMTITCAATSSEEVGTFDIVVSEAEAENYEITFVNGTLTIEAVETPVDNTFEEEGASYEKQDDGTVTFTEQENSTGENYEVPETVTHDGVEYQVTSIAEGAFKDNVNLKELSIPESIVSIGDDALAGCTNLEKINLYSDKPISIDQADASSVFSGVDTENCILYVPAGTAEAYRQAEGWKVFKNIVEMEDPDDINEINADDDTYQIYSLDGKQVEALQKGVNIIKYKKGSTQKVYVK